MNEYFVIKSFELHDGQLDNWKKLSKEIDEDISKAEGFISRDSGIDNENKVRCLIKWESKEKQENFMKQLMARDNWEDMISHFGSVVNMKTEKLQELKIF